MKRIIITGSGGFVGKNLLKKSTMMNMKYRK